MPIRVLIVDDSALVRKLLTEIVNSQPDMESVGTAPDPYFAREMIKALNPDVLTLDVEMPRMDGLDFLERLMRLRPMPVVMVSTLTAKGSEVTLRALELGAVDYVFKPQADISTSFKEYADEIAEKIRIAAAARVRRLPAATIAAETPRRAAPLLGLASTEKVIVVGASTGGTEAIKHFLVELPADSPAILITQHMPETFTRSFAERLDRVCPKLSVKEAVDGERVLPGHAYVAPGHSHLLLAKQGANYVARLSLAEKVNRHRPSVDVLFSSAARSAGRNAVGVILTGMGRDGAAGMLELKQAGARNFAQDEASCVVYGMPREAVAFGGVDEVASLAELPARVIAYLRSQGQGMVRV